MLYFVSLSNIMFGFSHWAQFYLLKEEVHAENIHLDPADMDFLKRKSDECKGTQNNAPLSEAQVDPYIKIVVVLEQALREGSATVLTKSPRTQLQADRERRMTR